LLKGEHALHLVGHLQTNKIGKVLPLVAWIQSIDSARLVDAIDTRETVARHRINALVQVNTSGESTKSGCGAEECRAVCERVVKSPLLNLRGLMTIGPLGGSEGALRTSFALLRRLGERIADLVEGPVDLSMGMSGDFEQAIEEGATIIRVGTILLGPR
jgi:pyridoxal phosphate enzyme (YggS family)